MSTPDPLPANPGPGAPGEPLLSVGALTTIITAGLAAAVAFGAPISDDQQAAVLAALAAVAPVLVAIVGRGLVFSPATVRRMVQRASNTPRV